MKTDQMTGNKVRLERPKATPKAAPKATPQATPMATPKATPKAKAIPTASRVSYKMLEKFSYKQLIMIK